MLHPVIMPIIKGVLIKNGDEIFADYEKHYEKFSKALNSAQPFIDEIESLGYKVSIMPNPKVN